MWVGDADPQRLQDQIQHQGEFTVDVRSWITCVTLNTLKFTIKDAKHGFTRRYRLLKGTVLPKLCSNVDIQTKKYVNICTYICKTGVSL